MKSIWTIPFMDLNGKGYLGNGVPQSLVKLTVVVTKSYLLYSDFSSKLVFSVLMLLVVK